MSEFGLNCAACTSSMKISRGCEKDSPIPGKWQVGEYSFQRCPIKEVDSGIYEYIRFYRRYDKGYLPNAGGWLDQSAKFNDVIDIIEGEIAALNREKEIEIEKSRKKP